MQYRDLQDDDAINVSARNSYNKKFYNSTSFIYDLFLNTILLPIITGAGRGRHYATIAAMVSDIHCSKVLDLACGTGNTIEYLPSDISYTGLDLADNMISRAEKRIQQSHISKYRFIIDSAHNMPFPEQEFDMVICNLALHFFPDHKQVIHELTRVLKPDGTFIGCLPVKGRNTYYDLLWQRLSRKSYRWGIPLYERDVKESCEASGFSYRHLASNGIIIYFAAVKQ